jgi:hypothetical protein
MSVNVGTVNQMTKLSGRPGESEVNSEGIVFDLLLGVGQWVERGSPTYKWENATTKAVHSQIGSSTYFH